MAKYYEVLIGIERGDKRFEIGALPSGMDLRGWDVGTLIEVGAIRELDEYEIELLQANLFEEEE